MWLSRDPAGFVDGPNVYAYVRQNPWTGWDPEGLADANPPNLLEFFDGNRTLVNTKGEPIFAHDDVLEKNVRALALRPENSKRLVVGMHGNLRWTPKFGPVVRLCDYGVYGLGDNPRHDPRHESETQKTRRPVQSPSGIGSAQGH